ncbi:ABC transporter permease [Streptomyces sp. XM4193]|uniref:ABC transporter permease n=1 Tax=Streptomyces sp. XM4193 TaxID=2929782 RepID=UPI001FF71E5E|nr:ABC transporter permease [Streptomyces sp. XM4193]MCK1797514.1 ABC transporter permease [Streptomyces sp. XM4193]
MTTPQQPEHPQQGAPQQPHQQGQPQHPHPGAPPHAPQQPPTTTPQGSPFDTPAPPQGAATPPPGPPPGPYAPQQTPPQQPYGQQPQQYAPQPYGQQPYAPQPAAPHGPPPGSLPPGPPPQAPMAPDAAAQPYAPQQPPPAPQSGGYGGQGQSGAPATLTKEPQQTDGGRAPADQPPGGFPQGGQQPNAVPQQAGSAAAVAPYQSSMPIPKTHLGHALASEWTKIRSVRSTVWALVTMFLLTLGIGFLVGVGVNTEEHAIMAVLGPNFYGLMFGQLAIISMGVLVISSEYTTGMIRTTMTACPQRARVLTAKATVFFLLSFMMTLLATGVTGLLNNMMLGGKPLDGFAANEASEEAGEAVATGAEWLAATVGASLYVALLGVLALAFGALLRSAPAAITIMIGLVLMPIVISFFLLISEKTADLSEKFREFSPLNGLSTLHRFPMAGDSDATGWPLLGLLAGVTAVVLAAAYTRLAIRDV